jgi:hypothetical protein
MRESSLRAGSKIRQASDLLKARSSESSGIRRESVRVGGVMFVQLIHRFEIKFLSCLVVGRRGPHASDRRSRLCLNSAYHYE